MKDLLHGGRAILLDAASTLFFLLLYALTGNIVLAVVLGIALAAAQIGARLWRRERPDALQWISLVAVVGGGAATLATHDARFVMLKPTILYTLVGLAMLRRGWMTRYMPERALQYVPDLVIISGYVWAGLMFATAALNVVLAMTCSVPVWGTLMTGWGIGSKILLFLAQFVAMKAIGMRRARQTVSNGRDAGNALFSALPTHEPARWKCRSGRRYGETASAAPTLRGAG